MKLASGRRVFHSPDVMSGLSCEGKGVTHAGACGSKNVGTSNHKADEKSARRKTKVSFSMLIMEGLVGPKGMAKAAPDGQQVNIPAPVYIRWSDEVQYAKRIIGFDVRIVRIPRR